VSDIHIPGLGNIPKGWAVTLGIGAAGVVFVAYRHYKSQAATAAPSTTAANGTSSSGVTSASGETSGDPYPPDGTTGNANDPYSTDPSTGETYGDEGSYGGYGAAQDAGEGYYPATTTTATATTPTATANPTTAQQWVAQAQTVLTGLGYSAETVASALGQYVAGMQLSAANANIAQIALSEVPYPGTAPPVRVAQSSPAPTGSVVVPNLVGGRVDDATSILSSLGLKTSASPSLSSRKPGIAYYVTKQSPKANTKVSAGSTVDITISTKA
jgi:hypothetical protein